jgi:hypothetical protein
VLIEKINAPEWGSMGEKGNNNKKNKKKKTARQGRNEDTGNDVKNQRIENKFSRIESSAVKKGKERKQRKKLQRIWRGVG